MVFFPAGFIRMALVFRALPFMIGGDAKNHQSAAGGLRMT
jgi:hypothetical protein